MIQSMTGYAAAAADSPRGTLSLELRAVNSRYLDVQLRVADELRSLEPMLRELIAARVARGKVDCRLWFAAGAVAPARRSLNSAALEELARLAAEAQRALPHAGPLRVADVLRWPGVIAEPALDEERTRAIAERLCRAALDDLTAARAREGAKLAASVQGRVAEMRRRLAEVAPLVPQSLAAYQAKLAERLREAIGSADDDRIRAELAVFGAKIDVDEELERLGAHLGEVERALENGGTAGKRLDFLAQELNREANTLASKAASREVADCALELKLLVERMREQVQNIE
ncbi:MAG: YicC family protein [Betaproteobacteria bacterium RIFCSPHIGHO2_12_FULL_69_13]|nr:MAG: YicC family protein [Betaproteobacteria bacterium RIFCSPHIGHO2_12_FULL_69_13]OGA66297.1 MAG: YicC family protein [Betaproteobacteria bacterium RIFCSPLOWO2_12_FULL_68_20]